MDIKEIIRQRRSVRSFNGEPVSDSVRKELLESLGNIDDPFEGDFTIRLRSFDLKDGYRPATYGMIKGASDFFLIGMADDEKTLLSVGFCFEQIVLKASSLGLGTCWIAATFRETDFDSGQTWPANERLRIVCPVGYPARKTVVEKITRMTLGSRSRRPFSELFFDDNFCSPLAPDSRFGESLEMMRLAPSSKNSQPWRALVKGNAVHFYYVPKSPISILDCGIGLCHFYFTEKADGRNGLFHKEDTIPGVHENWMYLISYINI